MTNANVPNLDQLYALACVLADVAFYLGNNPEVAEVPASVAEKSRQRQLPYGEEAGDDWASVAHTATERLPHPMAEHRSALWTAIKDGAHELSCVASMTSEQRHHARAAEKLCRGAYDLLRGIAGVAPDKAESFVEDLRRFEADFPLLRTYAQEEPLLSSVITEARARIATATRPRDYGKDRW